MDISSLHSLLLAHLDWNPSRIKCFIAMIYGMIGAQNAQHRHLIHGFKESEALRSSLIRRVERFFQLQPINFVQIASLLYYMTVKEHKHFKMHLAIDRTNWKFGETAINILVIAWVIDQKTAIPLFWETIPHGGTSCSDIRIRLLSHVQTVFGFERVASLTADREFIGQEWLTYLVGHKIPFYIRLKDNRLVEWAQNQKRPLKDFGDHLCAPEIRYLYKAINDHKLSIAITRSSAGDLVVVCSNTHNPKKILHFYRYRWTIELMFRNMKTSGFDMENTHMKAGEKIEKLMAIIAIALVLCYFAGAEQEEIKPTPYKKTVGSFLYSTFKRGVEHLTIMINRKFKKFIEYINQILDRGVPMQPYLS